MRGSGEVVGIEFRDRRAEGGIDGRVLVRVNAGMGHDAIAGKATARCLKLLYQKINGPGLFGDDPDPDDAIEGTFTESKSPAISSAAAYISTAHQAAPEQVKQPEDPEAVFDRLIKAFAGVGVTEQMIEEVIACPVRSSSATDHNYLRHVFARMQKGEAWADIVRE